MAGAFRCRTFHAMKSTCRQPLQLGKNFRHAAHQPPPALANKPPPDPPHKPAPTPRATIDPHNVLPVITHPHLHWVTRLAVLSAVVPTCRKFFSTQSRRENAKVVRDDSLLNAKGTKNAKHTITMKNTWNNRHSRANGNPSFLFFLSGLDTSAVDRLSDHTLCPHSLCGKKTPLDPRVRGDDDIGVSTVNATGLPSHRHSPTCCSMTEPMTLSSWYEQPEQHRIRP